MSRFTDYFDLTVVISLPEREDRRAALRKNLAETGLAQDEDLHWLAACRADHAGGPPQGWTACKPAWGCLQSHLAAMDLAMERGAEAVLILEDDAHFSCHASRILPAFMESLPARWAQIYLGGNHALQPHATGHPLVWRAGGVTATHAYAVSSDFLPVVRSRMADMTDYVTHRGWHCDTHLAHSHRQQLWPAYTPSWWLAAQEDSVSDLNGKRWPRRWLHNQAWRMELPFVLVEDTAILTPQERQVLYFDRKPVPDAVPRLLEWMFDRAGEAITLGSLPALTRAQAPDLEILCRLWPAGIIQHPGADLPALADYPFNGLFPHPMSEVLRDTPSGRN